MASKEDSVQGASAEAVDCIDCIWKKVELFWLVVAILGVRACVCACVRACVHAWCPCVCVCVCMCMCVCVCVCVCVHVLLLEQCVYVRLLPH